jgi:hypothetical protein
MKLSVSIIRKANARYDLVPVEVSTAKGGGTRRQDPIAHFVSSLMKEIHVDHGDEYCQKKASGIFVGCNSGGIASLVDALRVADSKISPHFVKDWFPATIQGVASIQYEFRGFCKTFCTQHFSDLTALWSAAHYVGSGRIKSAIVVSCFQTVSGYGADIGLNIEAVLIEIAKVGSWSGTSSGRTPWIDIQTRRHRVNSGIVGPWIRQPSSEGASPWRGGGILGQLVDETKIREDRLPLECGIDDYELWVLQRGS